MYVWLLRSDSHFSVAMTPTGLVSLPSKYRSWISLLVHVLSVGESFECLLLHVVALERRHHGTWFSEHGFRHVLVYP